MAISFPRPLSFKGRWGLAESSLSFLGVGVTNPNQPNWGAMLQLGQPVAAERPTLAVWPGLAIAMTVFSFNMLGDASRHARPAAARRGRWVQIEEAA